MNEQEKQQIEKMLVTIKTMRIHQKRFFSGDKGSMKQAIFYENLADNEIDRLIIDSKLTVTMPKGPAPQGKLI